MGMQDHHYNESESHDYWDYHDDKKHDHKHDRKCSDHHFDKKGKHCVAEVLEAIHEAQKKVKKEDGCKTSCEKSIKELLGDCKKPKKNTIPFILYCGCEPFKATGATTFKDHHSKEKKIACITSFIFRINDFDGKCASLELLTFKPKKCSKDFKKKHCSPCGQIDCENIDDLVKTGICITVDLSCFCAITCLPAVRL
jgi:hypothetical protein